jgi:16S rRNA processing protein RimM
MAEIAGAYGVRGWVRVKPHTSEPGALLGYRSWWIQRRRDGDWHPVPLGDAREHSGSIVAQLGGIESREAAMDLAGARIGVRRSELPPAREGEVYHADLVGLDVVNRAGVWLGRVSAVEEFGAHPLLRVACGRGVERLIPWVPAYVDGIDVASRRVDVDWEADY